MKTFSQFQEEIKNVPSVRELGGLGGGGGGTDSITDKSPAKSFKKRVKDVGKILTFPFHKRRKDPTEKFATEGVAALAVGGSKLIPALMTGIGAAGTIMQARKKNYSGVNLRVNRKAKKDDYYDGGEEKEKKKIQDKITKKDKKDVDKANKKMLKDITQKSKNPELEKNPVYQQLNRPTDINQFVGGKKIDTKTRRRMNAPENQFNSYDPLKEEAPTNNVGGGQIAGTVEAGDDPPVKKGRKKKKDTKKRYIYGGTGSRRMWMKKNNK